MNKELVNLTPHDIIVISNGEKIIYPISEIVARVDATTELVDTINNIPVYTIKYGNPMNIPEPKDNTIYIVSAIVKDHSNRTDLIAPNTNDPVRDNTGKIIAVKGFIR